MNAKRKPDRDENEAVDRYNTVKDRTRGATKPGDEAGLPGPEDRTSSM